MIGLLVVILIAWILATVIGFFNSLGNSKRIRELEEQIRTMQASIREKPQPKETIITKSELKEEIPQGKPAEIILPPKVEVIEAINAEKTEAEKPKPANLENIFEYTTLVSSSTKEEIRPKPDDWASKEFSELASKTSAEWEALIGGKILNRIGALALIIGVGFFLKYAFDNNWITETMRVLMGFVAGTALLYGGHYYSKNEFKIFSQGLVGAGIAILYLSVYASFNFYHLVSQYVAVGMMSAVTVVTLWQAFKYDSLVIVLLAMTGGYLTPFLLSTGGNNESGLFSYITAFDIGLLAICWKKATWWIIEPLSLFATIIIFTTWDLNFYSQDQLWTTTFFLVVFWILFHAVELLRIIRTDKEILPLHQAISLVNAIFFFISLYNIMDVVHHEWMGLITIAIAAIYAGVYILVLKKRKEDEWLQIRYLLSVIILSVIAAAIQFKGFELAISWAVESTALILMAWRFKNNLMMYAAVLLFLLTLLAYSFTRFAFQMPSENFALIFNLRFLALTVMLVAAIATVIFSKRIQHEYTDLITIAFTYTWIGILFTLVTVETSDYLGQLAYKSDNDTSIFFNAIIPYLLGMEWLLVAIPLMFYSFKKSNKEFHVSSLILTSLSILFICISSVHAFEPMSFFIPVINLRALSLVFLVAALYSEIKWTDRSTPYFFSFSPVNIMRVVAVVAVVLLVTVESRDFLDKLADGSEGYRKSFFTGAIPFVLGIEWILLAVPTLLYSLRKRNFAIQTTALLLTGFSILIICIDGFFVYEPLAYFIPLINIRALAFICLAATLFILANHMEKSSVYLQQLKPANVMRVILVTAIFIYLTVEVRDIFERKLSLLAENNGVSQQETTDSYHNLQQLCISGVWLVYSVLLMVVGIYRSRLNIRIVSIVILGITIGKVFLFDLSYLNSLNRIFSFIGLGVILLLISFLYQKYRKLIFEKGE